MSVKKIFSFLGESREELKKVSWPNRDDVSRYTAVTVITLIVFAVYILSTIEIANNSMNEEI